MEAILLKKKNDSISANDIVVFDELLRGVITFEWFVPVFTGSENGLRIIPLSYLIDNFCFPEREGQMKVKFLYFLKGANPELIERIEFYKSDEIEIETIL